jgi:outer membrane protein assembly factor BamB
MVPSTPIAAEQRTILPVVNIHSSTAGPCSGTFYALNTDDTVKWSVPNPDVYSSAAIGVDGTIYVGSDNGTLYALNPADGSIVWTFAAIGGFAGAFESSPAIGADGTVYAGSYDHNFYALGAATVTPTPTATATGTATSTPTATATNTQLQH